MGMMNFAQSVVSISPAKPVGLAGRRERRIWRSIHQDLEANVLVLSVGNRRMVLVAIDALFVGSQLSDEIVKACDGVDPAAIVVVASHTHSSPALETTKPLLGEA